MDIPLCHEPQIILTNEDALPLCEKDKMRIAGALADSVAICAWWKERLNNIPAGIALDCPPRPDIERCGRPVTPQYIRCCKRAFRPLVDNCASFYYLRSAPDFASLRAAVLALGELCGRTLIAELSIEEEGRMADGTEVCAAVGVLQRIGVTTVILTAHNPEPLSEALYTVAPYARVSLGACVHSAWIREGLPMYNVEVLLTAELDSERRLLDALKAHGDVHTVPRDHNELILAPDGTNAHFINPTIDISDEIECGHRLEEALLDAEDDAGALKLLLKTEEDVVALEEHSYMISRPVCLCAEDSELLEEGLRVYPGLALYDGTWEQPEEMVRYWEQKYGLIRL